MITMDKKYQTRDGRDARILCVDRNYKMPVLALVSGFGVERVEVYTQSGASPWNSAYDLVEAPVEEYRYARCTNADNRFAHYNNTKSVTFWSVSRTSGDNLKATFIDNKLVKIEIIE